MCFLLGCVCESKVSCFVRTCFFGMVQPLTEGAKPGKQDAICYVLFGHVHEPKLCYFASFWLFGTVQPLPESAKQGKQDAAYCVLCLSLFDLQHIIAWCIMHHHPNIRTRTCQEWPLTPSSILIVKYRQPSTLKPSNGTRTSNEVKGIPEVYGATRGEEQAGWASVSE